MNNKLLIPLTILAFAACSKPAIDEKPIKEETGTGEWIETKYQNPVIRNNAPDPSVFDDRSRTGYFYAYSTQNGDSETPNVVYLPVYKSKDMVNWEFVGNAFGGMNRPQWVAQTRIWAPDIEYIDGRYVLYYSEGHWNDPSQSAVGVAVSDSPTGPFTWENIPKIQPKANPHGMLVDQATQGTTNTIDPCFMRDVNSGKPYLFWGSFGSTSGVWAIELTDDGLAIAPGAEKTFICYSMEGTYVHYKNGYYYCFGSKGTCCVGGESTYHIVVARSKNILGPYEGRDGKLMTTRSDAFDNPANTIMSNPPSGIFAGTGHDAEILTDDKGNDWMCYHAYWKNNNWKGRCMNLDQVIWGDGWPSFKEGHPSEGRINGPVWKNPSAETKCVVEVNNDSAEALLETGDPCGCRNTWALAKEADNFEVKMLYE